MEQQKVFKTGMFGFNKKMVLEYLYEVDEKARNSELELNSKIDELTNSKEEFEKKYDEVEAQFQIISSKLSVERENSIKSSQLIGELNEEIERQRRVIADKDREIQIQNERCKQLILRAETAEKKLEHFDQLSHKVGDLIMEAQRSADLIIEKAQTKADRISADAEKTTQNVYSEFKNIKSDISLIKKNAFELFDSVNQRIDKLEKLLDDEADRFSQDSELGSILNPIEKQQELDFSSLNKQNENSAKPSETSSEKQNADKHYIGSFFRARGENK